MKKIFFACVILVIIVIAAFFGKKAYRDYQFDKDWEQYQIISNKLDSLIIDTAKKNLKTNDLIFVCELRKGLWSVGGDVSDIQAAAKSNSEKYKNFISIVESSIAKDKVLNEFQSNRVSSLDTTIVGVLCTRINPETYESTSLYNDLLSKKYNTDRDSIGSVDSVKITKDDFEEYLKAKKVEEEFRLRF